MKYYLVAGESSGDLHGSLLIGAIQKMDPSATFRYVGGELMQAETGTAPYRALSSMAFMGFLEVIGNLRSIFKNLQEITTDVLAYRPDALILIDFPGFNLRLAHRVHHQGVKTIYFISPKIWAWNARRALRIKRDVDHMLVILPFEVSFYRNWGMEADYVGNPLMDAIDRFRAEPSLPGKPIIALLPGSRKQEIDKILPEMLKMVPLWPQYHFIIAGAPLFSADYYAPFQEGLSVGLVFGQTYSLLSSAAAAVVTSGTATLETALLGIPQVVVYKTSVFSFLIARLVIRVPYISLVNLILEKQAVKELIQGTLNPGELRKALGDILPGGVFREQVLTDYDLLKQLVGGPGASTRAAQQILAYLENGRKEAT